MDIKQKRRYIYSLGRKCGLVDDGNKQDSLHDFVYQLTLKESISELNDKQADIVIRQLQANLNAITEPMDDNGPTSYISYKQISKIFGLMYELAALSPSDVPVKERLCGIIAKELKIKVNPKQDIFKGWAERDGAQLIDTIKRYIRAEKRRKERADEQARLSADTSSDRHTSRNS